MSTRGPSRTERWGFAASAVVEALQELVDLQGEYQQWLDNLPQNLQGSATGEKLQAVCELQLEEALNTTTDATGLDLPIGFGRD